MSDTAEPDTEIEERSIHPVGDPGRRSVWAAILGVVLVALLLWWVNQSDAPVEDPRLTEAANLEFTPAPRQDSLELDVRAAPAAAEPVPGRVAANPLDQELRRLALKQAEAERQLAEQRRRAPILILDRATARATAGDSPAFEASNPLSPNDATPPDDEWASDTPGSVTATRISDPARTIAQGALIQGVLETAIQSDLPGLVRAVVSHDVYAFDGSRILIPKASRLIGHYRSALVRGQTRVFVVWDRLLRPDGVSLQIASPGTDLLGRSGLAGDLDTHFFKVFGGSILLSLIDGAMDVAVERARGDTGSTTVVQTGDSLSRAAEMALENSINIPPTVHVDQGTPIQVFVARDLTF